MCGEGGAWLDMREESKANVCEPLEALVLEAGCVLLVELCREHVDRKPIGEGWRRGRHVEQDGAEGEEGGERRVDGLGAAGVVLVRPGLVAVERRRLRRANAARCAPCARRGVRGAGRGSDSDIRFNRLD